MQQMQIYDKKDQIVMKLLHYFITEQGYSPIILQGAKDEIWLENQEKDYKIIRIVSNYIHNNYQLQEDLFKTKSIIKNIKKKTFNWTMDALSIFVNLGEDVKLESENHIDCVSLEKEEDISKYQFLYNYFPNINEKMVFDEKGINLFVKITNDINEKNKKEAKRAESLFNTKKPIMTYILMAVSILVFVVEHIPGIYDFLLQYLAVNRFHIANGEVYRLITGSFIHDAQDIFHIVFNMYALYIIGPQIEGFFGKWKYLIIYLVSAVAGSLLSILFSDINSIGASGAIFGLLGSMLYFGYYYRIYLGNVVKTRILPVILLNIVLGFFMPYVDNAAHIGGLIGGILISMAVGIKSENKKKDQINGLILLTLYILFTCYMAFVYK